MKRLPKIHGFSSDYALPSRFQKVDVKLRGIYQVDCKKSSTVILHPPVDCGIRSNCNSQQLFWPVRALLTYGTFVLAIKSEWQVLVTENTDVHDVSWKRASDFGNKKFEHEAMTLTQVQPFFIYPFQMSDAQRSGKSWAPEVNIMKALAVQHENCTSDAERLKDAISIQANTNQQERKKAILVLHELILLVFQCRCELWNHFIGSICLKSQAYWRSGIPIHFPRAHSSCNRGPRRI